MEAAPADTDVAAIGAAMAAEPDVVEVLDLHATLKMIEGAPAGGLIQVERRGGVSPGDGP